MSEKTPRRTIRRATPFVVACVIACVIGAVSVLAVQMRAEAGQAARGAGRPSGQPASRIVRVQIDRVESPAFEGREFGSVGRYELLLGRAFGELDPADPHNQVIVNLDRAPRTPRGLVEYSADFRIFKPVDMTRGNRAIFYDVPNRGNQRGFNLHQDFGAAYGEYPVKAADLGDGFLMEQGYTVVWSGWQGDVMPGEDRITAQLPVARRPDGSPIRRWITTELAINAPRKSTSFEGGAMRAYPAVAESLPKAMLYRRASPHAKPELIPRASWSFAKCDGNSQSAPAPSNTDVCLPEGFSPNALYYLVYEAQDPTVMGIGFAAIRDFVSLLRYDTTDTNPLVSRRGGAGTDRNVIRTAIMFGQSQPGRFIRDFVYEGWNREPTGRIVFDGVIPATAGTRRTYTNFEFASPGRFPRNVEDHYAPGDQFPFTYETLTDPVTGRVDGLLARCRITGTCPKVMQFDSANEVWSARASLVTTDGMSDVPVPDNVRIYQFAGTQHQAGTGDDPPASERGGNCQQVGNPAPYREAQRALLVAMSAWVTKGTMPPASQYSKISDGTLVPALPQAAQGFPEIPGVRYMGKPNDLFVNDYTAQPASHTGAEYRVLVPKGDKDGNDLGGVRSTIIQVPIGTYAGWNLRKTGFIENEGCGTNGSYIAFAKKKADRGADPRLSLEERYGTHEKYVAEVRAAAERLQKQGFLLPQDAQRIIKQAEARNLGLPRAGRTQ